MDPEKEYFQYSFPDSVFLNFPKGSVEIFPSSKYPRSLFHTSLRGEGVKRFMVHLSILRSLVAALKKCIHQSSDLPLARHVCYDTTSVK